MSRYVYPRLTDTEALARVEELRDLADESVERLREFVTYSHDRAAPVPTGGPVASGPMLRLVREGVLTDLGGHLGPDGSIRGGSRDFDWALGRSLHQRLAILTSDAAHRGPWNFLSALVFPDLVWARFPDPSEDRALGGPRNALRRVWRRYDLLGHLDGAGAEALNEDELVQLTERTALARNRRLASALARQVIRYEGPRRMEYTRGLAKRATFVTGPLLLDVLSDGDLDDLVEAVASGSRWEPGTRG